MRAPKPDFTTVSMVSASQTPAATSAIASRFNACCSRLPTKPGMSFLTCTGSRPAPRRRSMVFCTVSSLVASFWMTSTSGTKCGRIPEMRANHAVAMHELRADLGRPDRRAVAGEDGRRRSHALELSEDLLLDRQFFRRRFEHEGDVFHRGCHLVVRRDAAEHGRI